MTLDDAFLYLGISDDASLEEIERAYKVKTSMYDISRFTPETPEMLEAKRMNKIIKSAYDCIIEAYSEFNEKEENEPRKFTDKYYDLLQIILAFIAVAGVLFFIGVVIFHDSGKMQNQLSKAEEINKNNSKMITAAVQEALKDFKKNQNEEENEQLQPQNNNNKTLDIDYSALAEKVMPAMVRIDTDAGLIGSGFFASSNGDILTNYHVIEGAEKILVTPIKGTPSYALVKDFDAEQDIALIVINAMAPTLFLKISDKLPVQGEAVMAVGNPKELDGTISNGIISAFRENNRWIQFTAPISPGSSGGALVNSIGEVVGMPTKHKEGQNLNFAISSTILKKFLNFAQNKTPRQVKVPSRKTETQPSQRKDSNPIFVRKDELYEMYFDPEYIERKKNSNLVSFITIWYPTEKAIRQIEKTPEYNFIPGKKLNLCALWYTVNFSNNTYVHLRTVNFYSDGTVARDYIRPDNEIKWRSPKKGSRAESLMNALRKYLGVKK